MNDAEPSASTGCSGRSKTPGRTSSGSSTNLKKQTKTLLRELILLHKEQQEARQEIHRLQDERHRLEASVAALRSDRQVLITGILDAAGRLQDETTGRAYQ